jgi:hypothetical protein
MIENSKENDWSSSGSFLWADVSEENDASELTIHLYLDRVHVSKFLSSHDEIVENTLFRIDLLEDNHPDVLSFIQDFGYSSWDEHVAKLENELISRFG